MRRDAKTPSAQTYLRAVLRILPQSRMYPKARLPPAKKLPARIVPPETRRSRVTRSRISQRCDAEERLLAPSFWFKSLQAVHGCQSRMPVIFADAWFADALKRASSQEREAVFRMLKFPQRQS